MSTVCKLTLPKFHAFIQGNDWPLNLVSSAQEVNVAAQEIFSIHIKVIKKRLIFGTAPKTMKILNIKILHANIRMKIFQITVLLLDNLFSSFQPGNVSQRAS